MNSSYGKGGPNQTDTTGKVIPGSPDARANAYKADTWDALPPISGYGKKKASKKNYTASGPATASGMSGKVTEAVSSESPNYKKSYGGAAGSPVS